MDKQALGGSQELKILIVDDEVPLLELFSRSLQALQAEEVVTRTSGVSALSHMQVSGFRPDLIVTDFRMPGNVNGLELIRLALANEFVPAGSRHMIVTGRTRDVDADEAAQLGVVIIPKPITPSGLLNQVRLITGYAVQ